MPTHLYKDYISPQDPANSKWLAQTLGSIRFPLCVAACLIDKRCRWISTNACWRRHLRRVGSGPSGLPTSGSVWQRASSCHSHGPTSWWGSGRHYPAYIRSSRSQMRPSRLQALRENWMHLSKSTTFLTLQWTNWGMAFVRTQMEVSSIVQVVLKLCFLESWWKSATRIHSKIPGGILASG